MPHEVQVSSDEALEEESLSEELDGVFKPLILGVATLMLKLVSYVAMAAVLAIGMSTASAEAEKETVVDTIAVAVVETGEVINVPTPEKPGLWDTIKSKSSGYWNTASDKASEISTGVLNPDKKIREMVKRERAYLDRIAQLEEDLIKQDMTIGVEHRYLANCSQEVSDYLLDLLKQTEAKE